MQATKNMIFGCAALFIFAYAVLWYFGLFSGLGFHGTIAAVLGVILATGIGVGLMALIFHSNRARHDQRVHDATKPRQ